MLGREAAFSEPCLGQAAVVAACEVAESSGCLAVAAESRGRVQGRGGGWVPCELAVREARSRSTKNILKNCNR